MCLLLIGFQAHSDFKLIVGQNRDEFYDRPASGATFWNSEPELLAGKDLKTGGTWLGITKGGRIAAITNYREPFDHCKDAPSRGILVRDYLLSDRTPSEHMTILRDAAHHHNGFNLIFGDQDGLYYYSNKGDKGRSLSPGLYGLSNHFLDSQWPKVRKGKKALADILSREKKPDPEKLFEILTDRSSPDDQALPVTGVGLEWERILSPIFVSSDTYGTRCSTVILIDYQGNVTFVERSFTPSSYHLKTAMFEFKIVEEGS